MTRYWRSHPLWIIGIVCALVVVGAIGYWGGYKEAAVHYEAIVSDFTPLQEHDQNYPLIAPLLGYHAPQATEFGEYIPLKSAIQNDINTETATGAVSQVSVYFRDLNSSLWVGINQDDDYYPASLLKVPVMIAYYKEAESDPSILNQEIVYQTVSTGDPFVTPSNLVPGEVYTVNQLINAMIVDSDNGATFTLLANISTDNLNEVYANLGIPNPGDNSADYQISTRTYALFFRILYNATYLDPEYSNKALDLLSQTTFTQGLVSGVPVGTQVAHKYGEHVLNSGNTVTGFELSDCGVVYYPAHPYLLCVMTSANTVQDSENVIQQISATTYNAIAAEYPASTNP
jgi:beta-lactamase class A